MPSAGLRLLPLLSIALVAGACGARQFELPVDPGVPLPDFDAVHREIAASCTAVRSLRSEVSLRGRAAGEGLSGTLHVGFRVPGSMRLQLRAGPFGTLGFDLAANDQGATLLLPRDNRVVRDARAEQILGALIGIALSPDDLLAIFTGCVTPAPRATGGRSHDGGLATLQLEGGATLYLQRGGTRWRLRAARRGEWRIDYLEWPDEAAFPARVQLTAADPEVELRAGLAETETNITLPDNAFVVEVPSGVEPMTLEELRRSGPLRESSP
jgi:outer membrane biogenesis lipoprotein LolB